MGELIIISGGPGSGKTTLLEYLNSRGFNTFDEVPRYLIEKNLKENNELLPWVNLPGFADLCYEEMMKQKIEAVNVSFVDRAIGDIIAYLHRGGFNGDEYKTDAQEGYSQIVFLMKPDKRIYVQDEVRPHSFEEALDIHNEIHKVYTSLGYTIVELPFSSVEIQCAMVLETLDL